MRYVIGVDGGQTSTTVVVADETGRLLGIGQGGPANHIHEPGGIERIERSLTEAVRSALARAELENAHITAACLGMTGCSDTMRSLCEAVVPADHLIFGHDTRIALYSVTFGRPGVVIIGGTGAAAYGLAPDGREAQAGGWGYLMGDEGSGYWIALRVLNACCRASDGLAPATLLLPLLLQRLNVPDLSHVHHRVYSGSLARPDLAALSVVATEAAMQGDATARRILREAGKELALTVNAVLRQLGQTQSSVVVGTVGGVFRAGRYVLKPFRETVLQTNPHADIRSPRVPAAVAAALMALEEMGVALQPSHFQRVEASLPALGIIKM